MKPKLILLALLSPIFVLAQEKQKPWDNIAFYPPSAATLIKALDCPPAHYTGNPEISVPLYTVESSELSFPISLGFNINAYRMASSAPETIGAGWSLNADLVITRVINGTDDIKSTYKSRPNFLRDYRNAYDVNLAMYRMGILDGIYDTEPDKFYYRLPTKSGHFYFSPDGSIVPIPYNGIKIELSGNTFIITDTDGATYTFDVTDTTRDEFNFPNVMYNSAWHCSKIVSASQKDSITFVYHTQRSYKTNGFHPYVEVYDRTVNHPLESQNTFFKTATEAQILSGSVDFERLAGPKARRVEDKYNFRSVYRKEKHWQSVGGTNETGTAKLVLEIRPAMLTEIQWKGGKVKFNYGNNYEYVTSVSVSNNVTPTKNVANIVLTQTGTGAQRVLTKVKVNNDEYGFSYPNQTEFPYGEGVNNFWGNEAYSKYTSGSPIPMYNIDLEIGYQYAADGKPEPEAKIRTVQIGNVGPSMLTKYLNETPMVYFTMSYPNGGKVEYYMEHHKLGNCSTGGLRLASVRYLDTENGVTNVKRIKKYEYVGGRNDIVPTFGDTDHPNCYTEQELIYCSMNMSGADILGTTRKRVFYPHTTGYSSFNGESPITYGSVTEYDLDPSSPQEKILSKKEYRFDTGTYKLTGGPTYPYPLQKISLSEGQLLGVKEYRCDDDSFTLVRSVDYTYADHIKSNNKIYRLRLWPRKYPVETSGLKLDNTFRNENTTVMEDYDYIPIGCSRLTKEVETSYADDGNAIVRTSDYYYDNADTYHMPTRVETTASNGDKIVEYTLRPCDYTSGESVFATLKTKNIIDVPIEQVTVTNGSITGGEMYKYNADGSVIEAYSHESESQTTRSPISYTYVKSTAAYSGTPRYIHYCTMGYDINNRLSLVCPYNLPSTYYLWGYQGLYLVAKISNGGDSYIDYSLGKGFVNGIMSSSNFTDAQKQSLDNMRKTHSDWHMTTAQYEPLVGIKVLTDPSGRSTYYNYYDSVGRPLKSVADDKKNKLTEYEYSNTPQ